MQSEKQCYRVVWTKMFFSVESEDKYVRDQKVKFETIFSQNAIVPFSRSMAHIIVSFM